MLLLAMFAPMLPMPGLNDFVADGLAIFTGGVLVVVTMAYLGLEKEDR